MIKIGKPITITFPLRLHLVLTTSLLRSSRSYAVHTTRMTMFALRPSGLYYVHTTSKRLLLRPHYALSTLPSRAFGSCKHSTVEYLFLSAEWSYVCIWSCIIIYMIMIMLMNAKWYPVPTTLSPCLPRFFDVGTTSILLLTTSLQTLLRSYLASTMLIQFPLRSRFFKRA